MKKNPTNREKRRGKFSLIKLLQAMNSYNIDKKVLANLVTPDFYDENKELFDLLHKDISNIKIVSYNIKSYKLLQDPVFEIVAGIVYNCKLPNGDDFDEFKELSIEHNIRISKDSKNKDYYPTLAFLKEAYNHTLKHRIRLSNELRFDYDTDF